MGENLIIDGRILDTDNRFFDYCQHMKIKDPFREDRERFAKRCRKETRNGHEVTIIDTSNSPEEEAWRAEWAKRRDKYLRLNHTFRLWDFHFWMDDWEKFKWYGNEYVDMSIYMPCDIASRQCSMECAYFLHECPRAKEELRAPEMLGFEGRWEFHDDDWNY